MEDEIKTKVIRIPAFYYLHVLNRNTNVTTLQIGPQTLLCQEHERVVLGPEKMLIILPRHYCVIQNPVVLQDEKEENQVISNNQGSLSSKLKCVVYDEFGQVKLRHAQTEIRFETEEPFPLFPGEKLLQEMTPLSVVAVNSALKLKAKRSFIDKLSSEKPVKRIPGEEWLFEGPRTYVPQVEVEIVATINATIIKPNQALKLRAKRNFVDETSGKERRAGDMWLMRKEGSYLPKIEEEIVELVNGIILTDKKALQLKALNSFVDVYGKQRKAGQEWLVTSEDTEVHLPDVYEKVIKEVPLLSLSSRQYCIIQNPVGETGKLQYGHRKLIKGEVRFFLKPGEFLEGAIQEFYVLGEEEALEVFCTKDFEEDFKGKKYSRTAGQTWYVYGPTEYIPSLYVQIKGRKKALIQIEALGFYFLYK